MVLGKALFWTRGRIRGADLSSHLRSGKLALQSCFAVLHEAADGRRAVDDEALTLFWPAISFALRQADVERRLRTFAGRWHHFLLRLTSGTRSARIAHWCERLKLTAPGHAQLRTCGHLNPPPSHPAGERVMLDENGQRETIPPPIQRESEAVMVGQDRWEEIRRLFCQASVTIAEIAGSDPNVLVSIQPAESPRCL
jgi:hypothetical protein